MLSVPPSWLDVAALVLFALVLGGSYFIVIASTLVRF